MTYRERALRLMLGEIGVQEQGAPNRGPRVDEYQRHDELPGEGYAWCMAFVQWAFARAGHALANKTASVGFFLDWAKRNGWVVTRPLRGDQVCFFFDNPNWPSHVGTVERVLRLGPIFVLRTVEGNTSSGEAGSQNDGDGVYRRTRTISASKVKFVRIPYEIPNVNRFDILVGGKVVVKDLTNLNPQVFKRLPKLFLGTKQVVIRKRVIPKPAP